MSKEESFTNRKNINKLHIDLGNPLKDIMQAMGEAMGLKLTSMFQFAKLMPKTSKKASKSKMADEHSKVKCKKLYT